MKEREKGGGKMGCGTRRVKRASFGKVRREPRLRNGEGPTHDSEGSVGARVQHQ